MHRQNLHIGITCDLRDHYLSLGFSEEDAAEFDSVETVEAIENTLAGLGHTVERIGTVKQLVQRLAAGASWDLVFNIAEGVFGFGREAQVPAVLDAYGIPYTFSDPLVLSLTLHKALTKRVLRDAGVLTADFAVVERVEDIDRVDLGFPLFAKPVAEGTGKGIDGASIINDEAELRRVCTTLLAKYRQPVLVEQYLGGREFTVGIMGTGEDARSLGALEVKVKEDAVEQVYSFLTKETCESTCEYALADPFSTAAAGELALAAWRVLGCRDGGRVDIKADDEGRMYVLELNPLAGLHPSHSDLPILCTLAGIDYESLVGGIVASASGRMKALVA